MYSKLLVHPFCWRSLGNASLVERLGHLPSLLFVVLFCSGLHIVAGCGAIGEHMTAPAAEPESYIRLCHLGSLVLQGTHPSEDLSNGIDLAPTRTEFRREYLHFSELSYTTHRLVSFQRR